MSRAGRVRRAALLAAVLILLTSCGSLPNLPLGVVDLLRPQPVVNLQQARRAFDLLVSERAVALHTGDVIALTRVETQPLLESDRGVIAAERHLYNMDPIGSTFISVTPFVPRLTSYPAWFMVEVTTKEGRGLAVVTRAGQRQPWKLESATVLQRGVRLSPAPAVRGYVQSGRFQRDLSSDLAQYFNAAETGEETRHVLPGRLSSGAAQTDLNNIAQDEKNGWSVSTGGYTAGPFSFTQAIRLRSGAALGFATIGWHLSVSVAEGAPCFDEDPTRGPSWSHVGASGSVSLLNLNGIDLFAVVESRAGDKVIGLVNEDTTTGLDAC